MRKLNGQPIPENLSFDELRMMLESSNMQEFALGCEALKDVHTLEAYNLLKVYLKTSDKYKYRYILSVIFCFDESVELQDYFIRALQSEEKIFVTTALDHLVCRNIWVTDEQILSCFKKNHNSLDSYYYQILSSVSKTALNIADIVWLFETAQTDSIKIAVAKCLKEFATKENYLNLYGLLTNSKISKLRQEACRIAEQFDRVDLLVCHADDPDGHIRKYVKDVLNSRENRA